MSRTTNDSNNYLKLKYNATTWDGIAENDSTSPVTTFYLSLHTASPGISGDQSTSEITYPGYARVAVTRNGAGWTVSGNQVSNAALAQFPQCTTTGSTFSATHVGIGSSSTGAGALYEFGALNSPRTISDGVQPQFNIGALTITHT